MTDSPAARDRRRLREAIELARQCPPSTTAFSVGAVITDAEDTVLATGYSRQHDRHEHAEEAALGKLEAPEVGLSGATIYTSLEPCGARASRPIPCAQHILDAGIGRIVFAWREPELFAAGAGARMLRGAGRETVEIDDLAPLARQPNQHLGGITP